MPTLHKTEHLSQSQRVKLNASAMTQEEAIKALFETCDMLTPSQVHYKLTRERIISPKTPLTSIRRAMNTLTNDNYLEKTDETEVGDFDKNEHYWRKRVAQTNSLNLSNQTAA